MCEKKHGRMSYGGIAKKYEQEMAQVTFDSIALAMTSGEVLKEMCRDDSDRIVIQSGWLNGPYQLLQKLEREVSDFATKVRDDQQFSDRAKQKFISEVIDPLNAGNRKARDIDALIMNGVPPNV